MLFGDHLTVIRGGGDLGTGVAYRLHHAGFPIVVLEIAEPLAIRRAVALASAVGAGAVTIEDIEGRFVESEQVALEVARSGAVAVLVSPEIPDALHERFALVDARLAKRNLGTTIRDAAVVVGLGPGFTAGLDCHAVVETQRGPHLGRVLWEGQAALDTGVPGTVGGESALRVLHAPAAGRVAWTAGIGDLVEANAVIGHVGRLPIQVAIGGVVRGLIAQGREVSAGLKIADVDPRGEVATCFEISDKALAVGGGALQAILSRLASSS